MFTKIKCSMVILANFSCSDLDLKTIQKCSIQPLAGPQKAQKPIASRGPGGSEHSLDQSSNRRSLQKRKSYMMEIRRWKLNL